MRIEPIISDLPQGFDDLRSEAASEGFRHVDTLWSEWQDGTNRFIRPGEQLLGIWRGGELAGVGGVTVDYVLPDALRMRRFYVRPAFRRLGAGRLLASSLLATARTLCKPIVLYAPYPASAEFWEAIGFAPDDRDGHTHILPD
jgi:GNAT superfamily N-acetyltransferase